MVHGAPCIATVHRGSLGRPHRLTVGSVDFTRTTRGRRCTLLLSDVGDNIRLPERARTRQARTSDSRMQIHTYLMPPEREEGRSTYITFLSGSNRTASFPPPFPSFFAPPHESLLLVNNNAALNSHFNHTPSSHLSRSHPQPSQSPTPRTPRLKAS